MHFHRVKESNVCALVLRFFPFHFKKFKNDRPDDDVRISKKIKVKQAKEDHFVVSFKEA